MNRIHVLFFSVLRERLGCASVELDLVRPQRAGEVLEELLDRYPAIRPFRPAIRIAVNHTYVDSDHVVHVGDEIALITPVSGG